MHCSEGCESLLGAGSGGDDAEHVEPHSLRERPAHKIEVKLIYTHAKTARAG